MGQDTGHVRLTDAELQEMATAQVVDMRDVPELLEASRNAAAELLEARATIAAPVDVDAETERRVRDVLAAEAGDPTNDEEPTTWVRVTNAIRPHVEREAQLRRALAVAEERAAKLDAVKVGEVEAALDKFRAAFGVAPPQAPIAFNAEDLRARLAKQWRERGEITAEQEAGVTAQINPYDPTRVDITIPLPPMTTYSIVVPPTVTEPEAPTLPPLPPRVTDAELREVLRLDAQATPGPWESIGIGGPEHVDPDEMSILIIDAEGADDVEAADIPLATLARNLAPRMAVELLTFGRLARALFAAQDAAKATTAAAACDALRAFVEGGKAPPVLTEEQAREMVNEALGYQPSDDKAGEPADIVSLVLRVSRGDFEPATDRHASEPDGTCAPCSAVLGGPSPCAITHDFRPGAYDLAPEKLTRKQAEVWTDQIGKRIAADHGNFTDNDAEIIAAALMAAARGETEPR